MRIQHLLATLATTAALLVSTTHVRANSTTAVQDFKTQMGSWNVITSNAFSTDSHVHGTAAVGGAATLSGNAEINSHGTTNAEALRVYGALNLSGTNSKVLAGGATIVKNASTNANLALQSGQPNPNQALIKNTATNATLTFNGNGGTPALTSLATGDNFFDSRDAAMQAANTELLAAGTLAPTNNNFGRLTFNATTAGVSVFNWNIDQLTAINEVGFNFAIDSFIVVNIIGNTPASTWNAGFNILGGSNDLAAHLLWNIGVATVNLTGSEILGSVLAPDSTINSYKQLNGSIYARSLNQHGQEIHFTPPSINVPEEPSVLVLLGLASTAIGAAAWVRRSRRHGAK